MSWIEEVNQPMYILLMMERRKELHIVCIVRKVIIRDNKYKKDLHHTSFIMNLEEQPQVIKFDPETVFGLSTDKKVQIPNIDFLLSNNCLTMTLQDIEYIEEVKTVGIRPFVVLPPFFGVFRFEADSCTPFDCMKTVIQEVYSGTAYSLTGEVLNTIKGIIYFLK